jgi:maleylpyruvate isomerase
VSDPLAALHALRASTADLLLGLEDEGWSDDDVRAPSRCPGWTRAHVLTHLARNADGISATLAGALRGEIVARYPGGPGSRDADIEAGASRPLVELMADVRDSAGRLDRMFGAVNDADVWGSTTDRGLASDWVSRRLVEVEVHRVDLRGAYTPDRWPPVLVAELLPLTIETLGTRTPTAITITVTDAVALDLAGRMWTVGDPAASGAAMVTVEAPDWALLAWLIGRPDAAGDALGQVPELDVWR